MLSSQNHKAIMIILDGYGVSTSDKFNAVSQANTPCLKKLFSVEQKYSLLNASGEAVGLPIGQIGNSEVGHLHLGAGRIVLQGLSLINQVLTFETLNQNLLFLKNVNRSLEQGGAVHLLGLISPGGVHSHEVHVIRLMEICLKKGIKKIYLHAVLDGRDVPPRSAQTSLQTMIQFKEKAQQTYDAQIEIASIVGRAYAMDRDGHWDRIEKAYRLITEGLGEFQATDPQKALELAYAREENDEYVSPTWCLPDPLQINEKDLIIFANFRADRARQLTQALTQVSFKAFARRCSFENVLTLTQYHEDLREYALFPQKTIPNCLSEIFALQNKQQLHIGETEKFAHVTFFFNGNRYEPFEGEDRILIPSDKSVKSYDLNPKMSAEAITEALIAAIEQQSYDFILVNYANADMVGHTGNFDATLSALEHLDSCLQRALNVAIRHQFEIFITADHGNAEEMFHPALNQKHTEHTRNPVPLFYIGKRFSSLLPNGGLIDVAPTILTCLELPVPPQMTGKNLGII